MLNNLIFAGQCLYWANAYDDALEVRTDAFNLAMLKRWPHYAVQAAVGITTLYLERDDVESARTWLHEAESLAATNLSRFDARCLAVAKIKIALASHDTVSTKKLVKRFTPEWITSPLPTTQATAIALSIRELVARNGSHKRVKVLTTKLHRLCNSFGTMRIFHYEFFSLYLAYTYLQQHDDAKQVIADYFTSRNDDAELSLEPLSASDLSLGRIALRDIIIPKLAIHGALSNA